MKKYNMCVCIIHNEYYNKWGGAGLVTVNVSKELIYRGYNVHVIALTPFIRYNDTDIINGKSHYHLCYYPERELHSLCDYILRIRDVVCLEYRLYRLVRKIKPELIHDQTSAHIRLCYLINLFQHIPYCFTYHNYPGLNSKNSLAKVNDVLQKYLPFVSSAAKMITVNPHLVQPLKEYFGRCPIVIPNGADLKTFYPLPEKIRNKDAPIILTVTRLVHDKGLEDFIVAFTDILKQFPTAKLQIVGDGPLRELLENLVQTLKLNEHVIFAGFVPNDKLVTYYQHADIYVLPSWNEGFPIVTFEAMGCGLPIVATNVGNLADVVKEGNGIIVPIKSPDKLAEAVCKILSLPDSDYHKMSGNNIVVAQNHSWEKIAKQYEELFLSIVSDNKRKRK